MGLNKDVTAVTVAFGSYRERYLNTWLDSVFAADPKPAQIIIATDEPVDVADNVQVIVCGEGLPLVDYWNAAFAQVRTKWLIGIGVDDVFMVDAFEPFTCDADVYAFPLVYGGVMSGGISYQGGFEDCYNLSGNPMQVYAFHKTSLMRGMPYRNFVYYDEAHWCEMAWFGRTVEFSDRARVVWVRHEDAISFSNSQSAQDEVNAFKARLRSGLIVAGMPE